MNDGAPKKLTPAKFAAGLAVLVAVMAGSMWLGSALAPHRLGSVSMSPWMSIVPGIVGALAFVLGIGAYAVVLTTGCFTFNYTRPFFKTFRGKMWFANLLVSLLLQAGFALSLMVPLLFALWDVLPQTVLLALAFFGPFIIAQLLMIWFIIWAPIETLMIRRRLARCGITAQQMRCGLYIGVSDPSRSSLRKLTCVEEDVGMLWLDIDRLLYRGDAMNFDVPRDNVLEIERKADAGATAAYFGAVHVIVRYKDVDGSEKRIRLHTEGNWTQTSKARALNALAARLSAWRGGAYAGADSFISYGRI